MCMTPPKSGAENLQALGVLTRAAAHDLNNYMAAILSYAELILETMPDDHAARVVVQGILSAGHRAVVKTRELDRLARKLAPIGQS
jgi:signal transduction histidine kinase